ncbi:hypothetical protein ACG74X_01000 [Marivita sp. S0852]
MLRRAAAFFLTLGAVLAVTISIYIGFWAAVIFYGAFSVLLCGVLRVFDRHGAVFFAISALTLGPFAGPIIMITTASACKTNLKPFDTHRNSPSVTRAEFILQEIAEGRRPRIRDSLEPSLEDVFNSGSLADQQTALAAIVRHYSADLRPVLERALASEIPAVRVQAATVFAHLRDTFAARARRLAKGEHALSGDALEAEILAVSASGFIDPAELDIVLRPVLAPGSRPVSEKPKLTSELIST